MYSGPVNRVIHNEKAQIESGVGDWCHYKEGWFPSVAVTDLDGNLILDNGPGTEEQPKWQITAVRVMVTRFWSASTAYISASLHIPDLGMYPPPPPRKLNYEHQFRIWAGHLDRPRIVRPEDLGTGNETGRLLPIFLGSVDTYALHCTSEGGYTLTVQARDRMKWFMDTQISYNLGSEMAETGTDVSRSDVIYGALARGLGDMTRLDGREGTHCNQVCGSFLDSSSGEPNFDYGVASAGGPEADSFYSHYGFLNGRTELIDEDTRSSPDTELRYFVTRAMLPLAELADAHSIIFERKTPLEIVKQMAMQEVYPMEVFQDHRSGIIYYTPRANDISALPKSYGGNRDSAGDSKRFFRTYFFRNYPKNYWPDINQMLISFKEEQSSLGMFTNFVVNKPEANSGTPNSHTVTLATRPWGLPDHTPCRFYTADDTTIRHAGESAAIAVQLARIFAKETRAGVAIVLGDPSLVPGEIIQVMGSPNATVRASDDPIRSDDMMASIMDEDRRIVHEYNTNYNIHLPQSYIDPQMVSDFSGNIGLPSEENGNDFSLVRPEQSSTDEILCSVSEDTNFVRTASRMPPTIWRVEGIMHKYSAGEGYTTELALASAF